MDVQAREVLDAVSAQLPEAIARQPLDTARRDIEAVWSAFMPRHPPGVTVQRVATSGPYGLIPLTILRPRRPGAGTVLYLHGGGWTVGSARLLEPVAALISERSGCEVVVVDYRLAPEARYPTQVVECVEAVRWIRRRFPRNRVAVIGESAGASLALATAFRLRGVRPLEFQVLLNPALDPAMTSPDYSEPPLDLTREDMTFFWTCFLGDRLAAPPAEVAPLGEADLEGLPSTVIITSGLDPLRQEGDRLAERLRSAGVPVITRRLEHQPHSVFWMAGAVTEAREALVWAAERIRLHFSSRGRKENA